MWIGKDNCHTRGGITIKITNQTEEQTYLFHFMPFVKKKAQVTDLKLLWSAEMEAKFGAPKIEAVELTK